MGLSDDLTNEVKEVFRSSWQTRDGTKVPEPEDIQLGNHAVKLDGTVLYADLADSTDLVVNESAICRRSLQDLPPVASRIIRELGGEITAFDGDRVMGVFIGDSKNTSATKALCKLIMP